MNALEILLSKRMIVKDLDKDTYYKVRDEIGKYKEFITEKLGYQLTVNQSLVKLDKVPAKAESFMGIKEFTEVSDYIFFCFILMFLENMEKEDRFVLSGLIEFIQTEWGSEAVDWTVYKTRRSLVRALKYAVYENLILIRDGDEDSFTWSQDSDVLYVNTGLSRYFMRNFNTDVLKCKSADDIAKSEWIDVDENRGAFRRHKIYRQLIMSMGMYRDADNDDDFLYVRNYRNLIRKDIEDAGIDGDLQVYKNSVYLVLDETSELGRAFPENNAMSDIVLLFANDIREALSKDKLKVDINENVIMSQDELSIVLINLKKKYDKGFPKKYREIGFSDFIDEVKEYMIYHGIIEEIGGGVYVRPVLGKIAGGYPKDF